jgi:hypothetical protein
MLVTKKNRWGDDSNNDGGVDASSNDNGVGGDGAGGGSLVFVVAVAMIMVMLQILTMKKITMFVI